MHRGDKRASRITLLLSGGWATVAASGAGTNVIQNGDFSAAYSGSGNDESIPDWPATIVTYDPTSCSSTWPSGCNGPFIYVYTSMTCDPLSTGTPYLAEDVPGGSGTASDAYVQQTITVPQSPGNLTFTSWGNLDPATATISIVTSDNVVHQALQFTPPPMQSGTGSTCTGSSPVNESIDMSAYAGQTVGLRIEAANANNGPDDYDGTFANFDYFSLTTGTSTPTTPQPPAKLTSYTSVQCNLDTQTNVDDCGATVGDASGGVSTPTGDVLFADGGVGTLLGSVCQLVPTPYSEGVASCTIQYRPADTSVQPDITATYEGDGSFGTSSGAQALSPGASGPDKTDSDCVGGCANNDVTYPNEDVPGQTTEPVTTQNGTKANEDEDDEANLSQEQLDEIAAQMNAENSVAGVDLEDVADGTELQAGDIDGAPSVTPSQAAGIGSDLDEVTPSAGNAGTLNTIDSNTAPDFPSDADSGGDDSILQRASAASVGSAPEASLVMESIYATHPTAAEIAAFSQEFELATAPTYSPTRALARLTLLVAEDVGLRVIAHDLGYKRVSELRKTLIVGSVRGVLKKHATTTLTIKASPLGGRLLRILDIVGLSHNVGIGLKVSVTPVGKHKTHSITTSTKVL